MSNVIILSTIIQLFWTEPAGSRADTNETIAVGNLALMAIASSQARKGRMALNPVAVATRSTATAFQPLVVCARRVHRKLPIIDDAETTKMDKTGGSCLVVVDLILAFISQVCEVVPPPKTLTTVIGDARLASNRMNLAQAHPVAHVAFALKQLTLKIDSESCELGAQPHPTANVEFMHVAANKQKVSCASE